MVRGEVALGRRDDPVFAGILDGSSHFNFDAAREAFGEALRLDPGCVQAWRGLATAFRVNGQSEEAVTILAKAESEIGWRSGLFLSARYPRGMTVGSAMRSPMCKRCSLQRPAIPRQESSKLGCSSS